MKTSSATTNHRAKSPLRLIGKLVLYAIAAIVAGLLIFALLIAINSPGTTRPFLNEDGTVVENSIAEKTFVEINGARQGMFIRGKSLDNPVLLFVHGGPCFPEYFLFDRYETGLEELFTVCYWEQRGGGLSYTKGMDPNSVTMDQLKQDTIAVTDYLRDRFGQEKIYLMAHSGGTFFAIQAAAESPERYSAYIGIAQIADQAESERAAYAYIKQRSEETGDRKTLRQLAAYPVLEQEEAVKPFFQSMVRDQSMHALGVGTMRNMRSVMKDVFLPVLLCKAYTVQEKINFWASKFTFIRQTNLHDEVLATDLTQKVQSLEIPVYFFSGASDMTVNYDLSKSFLDGILSPVKGFYTFPNSAHSPQFEEPEWMIEIMKEDILVGVNSLADEASK